MIDRIFPWSKLIISEETKSCLSALVKLIADLQLLIPFTYFWCLVPSKHVSWKINLFPCSFNLFSDFRTIKRSYWVESVRLKGFWNARPPKSVIHIYHVLWRHPSVRLSVCGRSHGWTTLYPNALQAGNPRTLCVCDQSRGCSRSALNFGIFQSTNPNKKDVAPLPWWGIGYVHSDHTMLSWVEHHFV